MEPKRKKNILIVDDEEAVRDIFVRTLEPGGFDIVAVADPDEGMEAARQFEPDIIYLSLLFPESNGLKVSKALHSIERLKQVPIVVLISYRGELDPKYTKTIGIVDVLVKPLKPADILAMTAKLLGEKISFESGEPTAFVAEESEKELLSPSFDVVDLPDAGGDIESLPEEPETARGTGAEGYLDATEGIEESEAALPEPEAEPAGQEYRRLPDLGSVKEEIPEESFEVEDARSEEESDGISGFAAEEEEPTEDDYEEEEAGKRIEWPDFDTLPETGKRPARKYLLFAGLVLLVAVVVFAALWAGILPGGGLKGKVFSPTVEETPLQKETVREVAPPEKVEDKDKAGSVGSPQEKSMGDGLAGPGLPSVAKEKPAAGSSAKTSPTAETKAVNEGLKEPKTSQVQRKHIYSVQVGVFSKEGNALLFAERLRKKGYDAFVEKTGSDGTRRVLVGKFNDYTKARSQSQSLLKNDGIKSVIYRH